MTQGWHFNGECVGFSAPLDDPTEPLVSVEIRVPSGKDGVRLPAVLDTGCQKSLFQLDPLEPLGISIPLNLSPGMPNVQSFHSVREGDAAFLGIPVPVLLTLSGISVATIVHVTREPLEVHLLGRDFLLQFIAAFALNPRREVFLGDPESIRRAR